MLKNRISLVKLFPRLKVKVGVELGVARGDYSYKLNKAYTFEKFYGVDSWSSRIHNDCQKLAATQLLARFPQVELIQGIFSEAVTKFEDNYFDFIYVDGYAHTGQFKGETLRQWFPKLKKRGIFAGHDYSKELWPRNYFYINQYLKEELGYKIHVTGGRNPSWYIMK